MANKDNPSGFVPYIGLGSKGKVELVYLPLLATNTIIGKGDPLTLAAGGANRAAASAALCGIAAEAKAASCGDATIAVWADPNQLFVAQTDDGTGDTTAATAVRKNVNFVAGNAVNGLSIAEIDEDTGNTTATLPMKLIRLSDEVGNAYGEFNRMVVKINNHQFGSHTGTAGVDT